MRKASCAVLGFVALLGVCADLAAAQQQSERPDFTGVWTTYTEPGQGRGGRGGGRAAGPGLPFTDEAKKKIASYRALVSPTTETPGGYCLGTGMPGSMLGSGGYPRRSISGPSRS